MTDKELPISATHSPASPASNYRSNNQVTLTSSSMLEHSRSGEWHSQPTGWQEWFAQLYGRLMSDPAISYAMTIFMTHRLLLFALGALFALVAPVEPPLGSSLLRDVSPYFWGPGFFLLAPWQRWDTNWYIRIGQVGYDIGNGTTNFPPLYSFLIGVLGRLLMGQYMLASLLISSVAYIVALVYLYRLTLRHFNEVTARYTLLFMVTFPSAFFLASGYTESLYLALTLAAFYYAEEKRWYLAAFLVALAGITRIQGIILVLPLGYLYLQQINFKWRKINLEGLALLLSPGLYALYMGWVYFILGDRNFGNHLAVIWHIKFAMPWESFFGGLFGFFDPSHVRNLVFNLLDLVMLTLFISLTIISVQRKFPMHYLIYSILSLIVYLTRMGTEDLFWMSMTRYLIMIFPAFMLMGQVTPRSLLKLSGAIQVIWATLFIFWMWAG
jgi:Gpi18-like mannosyltransferase